MKIMNSFSGLYKLLGLRLSLSNFLLDVIFLEVEVIIRSLLDYYMFYIIWGKDSSHIVC